METERSASTEMRRDWMSVLARAWHDEIDAVWDGIGSRPAYRMLRAPETGLVMVQARAGSTGRRFNFGEMTVTRCVVVTDTGLTGHAYVAGSDSGHSEIAAVLDAMLQDPDRRGQLMYSVIEPLRKSQQARRRSRDSETAATRVDFFTLVRGEDE